MKEVFKKVIKSEDIDAIKNCIYILAESCEVDMTNECLLNTIKSIQGEIDECHYTEEIARLHLCVMGELASMDEAKDYWSEAKDKWKINIWDWCVLWGEMKRLNEEKIKMWFPNISVMEYERKICDECISFLKNGKLPFGDINL